MERETTSKSSKQGPCGNFCFHYWLGKGCPDNCQYDYKKLADISKVLELASSKAGRTESILLNRL